MKNPPRRDRLATYVACWLSPLKPETQIHLTTLKLAHDCVTKKAGLIGASVLIEQKDIDHADGVITSYCLKLAPLSLSIHGMCRRLHSGELEYDVVELPAVELRFDSSQEVVSYINNVAGALEHPPTLALDKYVTREVYTNFCADKCRWMDEADWLAQAAVFDFMERRLFQAFTGLRKEGDAVKLTLKASSDVMTVMKIYDSQVDGFIIPKQDRNRLAEIVQKGIIPAHFLVTLEYREPLRGATRFARSLASHVENVEVVSVSQEG